MDSPSALRNYREKSQVVGRGGGGGCERVIVKIT